MGKILSQLVAGILGLWLAVIFIHGIQIRILPDSNFFGIPLTAEWHIIVLLGLILGLLNVFVKPVLKIIALPLRIVTLGLFGLIINMALVWVVDLIFQEISIIWFWPLFWTTIIIWLLGLITPRLFEKKEKEI